MLGGAVDALVLVEGVDHHSGRYVAEAEKGRELGAGRMSEEAVSRFLVNKCRREPSQTFGRRAQEEANLVLCHRKRRAKLEVELEPLERARLPAAIRERRPGVVRRLGGGPEGGEEIWEEVINFSIV